MKRPLSSFGGPCRLVFAVLALLAAGSLTPIAAGAQVVMATATGSATVLQTNLVSDLPGVAALTDANLGGGLKSRAHDLCAWCTQVVRGRW